MNRLIFFILLSLLPLFIFSQQKKYINFDKNWQISNTRYFQYYTCEAYVLESGAFDGPFHCYLNTTDSLVKQYFFINNTLDGEVLEFYDSGAKKLQAEYKNGQPINEWKEWDELGNIVVDKIFDSIGKIKSDKTHKKLSEYEKMYFGSKPFEPPVYTSKCIVLQNEKERIACSDSAMAAYYRTPPLPPQYFTMKKFSGKTFVVKLKYQLSEKGKVKDVEILESSGDNFLDELAEVHVLNMIPFESAKEYENPIKYWIEANLIFQF